MNPPPPSLQHRIHNLTRREWHGIAIVVDALMPPSSTSNFKYNGKAIAIVVAFGEVSTLFDLVCC
jgi:hypothetical protein